VQGLWEVAKALFGVTSLANIASRKLGLHLRSGPAKRVGYVDGAVMMFRREAFDEIGGFDSEFRFYCEDADLCLRLRRTAWDVVTVPSVQVTHVRGGSSTKVEGYSEKLLQAQAKAYCQLIRKHHSEAYLSLYRRLCILHARKMLLIYRCLKTFSPAANVTRASAMALAFERWTRIWTELET
jgi:GT2 family glycosyltransferase